MRFLHRRGEKLVLRFSPLSVSAALEFGFLRTFFPTSRNLLCMGANAVSCDEVREPLLESQWDVEPDFMRTTRRKEHEAARLSNHRERLW